MANALKGLYTALIPLTIGASLVQASIYDVKGGTRAVIFDRISGVSGISLTLNIIWGIHGVICLL